MLLLALETATDLCHVALLQDGRVLRDDTVREPRSHASKLAPLVATVLAQEGRALAELDAVAVSAGPGSFTGLRIGVSTAKGVAFAADAALIGVPTLKAIAATLPASEDPVLVTMQSRRGEVYAGLYGIDGESPSVLLEPTALELHALPSWIESVRLRRLILTGGSADLVAPLLNRHLEVVPMMSEPSAVSVGHLAWTRWQRGAFDDVAAFEPYYLKAFVAKPSRPIFRAPDGS